MIAGSTQNRTGDRHAVKRGLPSYLRYLHRDE